MGFLPCKLRDSNGCPAKGRVPIHGIPFSAVGGKCRMEVRKEGESEE